MKNTTVDFQLVKEEKQENFQVQALKKKKELPKGFLPTIVFFILWEVFAQINLSIELFNSNFFPPPSLILTRMWELTASGLILSSIAASTGRVLIGFLIGLLFAIFTALLMERVKWIEYWLSPILNLVGPIPALALLPLFIIWFGIGEIPKIILIAWTTFFPIVTNTLEGLRTVNSNLIRSALSLGASQTQIYRKVILPSTLPSILAGCQISLGLGFSALVVSEMMGTTSGLGYMIVDARNYFKITDMFVAIILIGLEYSLLSSILKFLDKKLLSWRNSGFKGAIE
ncbi:ABC transporter permease [Bacillus sp. AGMB 02131]|uniref:ABC transporter permease n=1 Tax=Peribacillus faecalis TaxID=2772559 RepID=A0A927HBB4_9BACI|nr:ABC transporter permease [Peribacillus faecalis]MBD3107228.1 ABC transporter permease [Peribacillus faecalis]